MIAESKPLFRTNTALSGDVQCIVDANNKVKFTTLTNATSLEFDSNKGSYASNAAALWSSLRMGISKICNVQYSNVVNAQHIDELSQQYDFTYICGCKYTKKLNTFRYFAPIWLSKTSMPKYFVLLRSDNLESTNFADIIKDATFVHRWQLDSIVELTQHIDAMSTAAVFVSHSSSQQSRIWGFDATTAQFKEVALNAPNIQDKELSPYDFDASIVESFATNNIICSQLVNLTFEFTDTVVGEHRYIGFYTSDEHVTEFTATTALSHLPFINNYAAGEALGLLQYIDGEIIKLPQKLDSSRLYAEKIVASFSANDGLKPNTFTRKRTLDLELTGKMTAGEKFEIIVNGVTDLSVYCQLKDAGVTTGERLYAWETNARLVDENQFLFGLNWTESLNRFIEAFNNASAKSVYSYSITVLDDGLISNTPKIRIETNCNSNDIDIVALLPWSMFKRHTFSSQIVQFDAAVTINNSLVISSIMKNYLQTANALLLHINDEETLKVHIKQILTLADIDASLTTTDSIVVLVDAILPDIVNSIAFDMLQIVQATAILCKLHNVYDFAGFYESEFNICTNTEFDIAAWQSYMTTIALQNGKQQYIDAINAHVAQLQGNDKPNAIKTLESIDTTLIFSDSVYDRFNDIVATEYDNKPNIKQHHFAAVEATDAMNKQFRANNSIAFNCTGFAPYERLTGTALDAFNYSWFVEGSGCPDYILQHTNAHLLCKSYSSKQIQSIAEFESTTVDVFSEKLTHKFAISDKALYEVHCFTYCYMKPDHITAYAMFKGVEYAVSSSYIGWRFAVVHIQGDSMFECKPKLVINNTFKTIAVVLPFKVIDSTLVNLDGTIKTSAIDKSIFYNTADIVALDANKIQDVDVSFNCYPFAATMTSLPYKGTTVTEPIQFDNDKVFIAIKVVALQSLFAIKDIFTVGAVTTKLQITNWNNTVAYSDAYVTLHGIEEIDMLNDSEAIIWVEDIIPTIEYVNGEIYSWPRYAIQDELASIYDNDITEFIDKSVKPKILESMLSSCTKSLSPIMHTVMHRFAPIAFYTQCDLINALNDIAVMQKTMQQQIIDADPLNSNANDKLLVNLTRYGTYCIPELQEVTMFSTLLDDFGNSHSNVAIVKPNNVTMHALTLHSDAFICVEQLISPLSTQSNAIYLNEQLALSKGPIVAETAMFAAILNVASTFTAYAQLLATSNEQTVSVLGALATTFDNSVMSKYYAEYLVAKLSKPTIEFYDAVTKQRLMPIALNEDKSKQFFTVQFDKPQNAIECVMSWQA